MSRLRIWTESTGNFITSNAKMNSDSRSLRTAYRSADALDYIATLLAPDLPPVQSALDLSGERLQPTIGRHAAALLDVLVRARRPQRILEIGTSFGYSACVLGRAAAVYGGTVLTVEKNPRLAAAARDTIASAGLQQTVEVVLGDARQIVPALDGSFDIIVQDGGKEDYLPLLNPLVDRLEEAGLLISDDVMFPVMSLPESAAHWGKAVADYNRALCHHAVLHTVWLPIGDGVAVSVKTA